MTEWDMIARKIEDLPRLELEEKRKKEKEEMLQRIDTEEELEDILCGFLHSKEGRAAKRFLKSTEIEKVHMFSSPNNKYSVWFTKRGFERFHEVADYDYHAGFENLSPRGLAIEIIAISNPIVNGRVLKKEDPIKNAELLLKELRQTLDELAHKIILGNGKILKTRGEISE